MKKLTATFPDGAVIDVQSLMAAAIDFKIETVTMDKPAISRVRIGLTSVPKTIMEHFTPEGVFSIDQSKRWIAEKGYNKNSSTSALFGLSNSKHIRKLGKGKYQFIKPMP